jgi:hypothetical protein
MNTTLRTTPLVLPSFSVPHFNETAQERDPVCVTEVVDYISYVVKGVNDLLVMQPCWGDGQRQMKMPSCER